jgi:pimeloyl-ACP methyl ester carboxylesterase
VSATGAAPTPHGFAVDEELSSELPLWREVFAGLDWLLLRASLVCYGYGVPPGDGSAVVTIPGFLGSDVYLLELRAWLRRIGYAAYPSGIGLNAHCPNLLQPKLVGTIERAAEDTGRRVHLVGHSLGGVLARSTAVQRPDLVASVVTLGSPIRGVRVHPLVSRTRDLVKRLVVDGDPGEPRPADCYTCRCRCEFLTSLGQVLPRAVRQLALYTRRDGVVAWELCTTGDPRHDREVGGTHNGLGMNAAVFQAVAEFLADRRDAAAPAPRAAEDVNDWRNPC